MIAATPALQERELAKHAALADVLAAALEARGVPDLPATLAARTGMAAFVHATTSWIRDPTPTFAGRLDLAEHELKRLVVASR